MSRSAQTFYEEMTTHYSTLAGFVPDEASDIAVRLHILAEQLCALDQKLEEVKKQSCAKTASGEALDALAQMRGINRKPALPAEGVLHFSRTNAEQAVKIPAGTICMTADGMGYRTTEEGTMPQSSTDCRVPAQSVEYGADTRAVPNSISLIRAMLPEPLLVNNPAAFEGGADEESDEALRARLLLELSQPSNGVNRAFYLREACAVHGISHAVAELEPESGALVITVAAHHQTALPEQTISALTAHLESLREPCSTIVVKQATAVLPKLTLLLETTDPLSSCEAAIKARLVEYVGMLGIGQPLTLARIGQVLMDSGLVSNYRIAAPNADIICDTAELIRLREEDIQLEALT